MPGLGGWGPTFANALIRTGPGTLNHASSGARLASWGTTFTCARDAVAAADLVDLHLPAAWSLSPGQRLPGPQGVARAQAR